MGLGPAQAARCVGPASLATRHSPLRIQGDVCPCLSFSPQGLNHSISAAKTRQVLIWRASGGASSNQRSARALSASGQALPSPLSTSFWRDTLRNSAKAVQAFWRASPLQLLHWLPSLLGKSALGLSALQAALQTRESFGCRSASRLTQAMRREALRGPMECQKSPRGPPPFRTCSASWSLRLSRTACLAPVCKPGKSATSSPAECARQDVALSRCRKIGTSWPQSALVGALRERLAESFAPHLQATLVRRCPLGQHLQNLLAATALAQELGRLLPAGQVFFDLQGRRFSRTKRCTLDI